MVVAVRVHDLCRCYAGRAVSAGGVFVSAPSGYRLEQALSCLQSLHREEQFASDDSDLMLAIEAGEQDVMSLLRRVILAAQEADSYADAVKARMDDLATRKARYTSRNEALRRTAFAVMSALEMQKFEDAAFTVSIGKSRLGLIVTDEAAIPEEYFETKRVLNKTRLNEAVLKDGEIVPGCEAANGMPSFRILAK
jgi:hypothetical protein